MSFHRMTYTLLGNSSPNLTLVSFGVGSKRFKVLGKASGPSAEDEFKTFPSQMFINFKSY